MKYMSGDDIRRTFLEYFQSKGHLILPSASLIPHGDPTLLLTNAGMVPFKPYFMGQAVPPRRRLTTSQKSFRTVDIDLVGDDRHLTLFEMLGNFSIGDYFKREAITFAWELLTSPQYFAMPADRLWPSIHPKDDEAFKLWREITDVPAERIVRIEDNWWGPAGDTGPNGPDSEIYFDRGEEFGCGKPDCKPGCDCARYLEFWNLVFMQFNRGADGTDTPLPRPSIDTGLGLERMAILLQGKKTAYETDIFAPLIEEAVRLSGKTYGSSEQVDYALRVIADHSRSVTFLIADGVLPSNEGRGHVLRRILRRAVGSGRELGLTEPFLTKTASVVIEGMQKQYPELAEKRDFLLRVIDREEQRFRETLDAGTVQFNQLAEAHALSLDKAIKAIEEWLPLVSQTTPLLGVSDAFMQQITQIGQMVSQTTPLHGVSDAFMQQISALSKTLAAAAELAGQHQKEQIISLMKQLSDSRVLTGPEVFKLYDTFGFPPDIAKDLGRRLNFSVDEDGFQAALLAQRQRARSSAKFGLDVSADLYRNLGLSASNFLGYDALQAEAKIVALIKGGEPVDMATEGEEVELVLDATPFYAEKGGQVGDMGTVSSGTGGVAVRDTLTPFGDVIVHRGVVAQGYIQGGAHVTAQVDNERRLDIARNHTATHLLHKALRDVLGEHAQQRGSLVAPDRLRFDFAHLSALSEAEVKDIEQRVNAAVRANYAVGTATMSQDEARQAGAVALFGEKYGDVVRMVSVGDAFSRELCGGTHLHATGQIGLFVVTSESSVGAGLRRIEAVSGRGAEAFVRERLGVLADVAHRLQANPAEIMPKLDALSAEFSAAQRETERLQRELAKGQIAALLQNVQEVKGVKLLAARVDANSNDALREMTDWLRDRMGSGIVVLGAAINERPAIVAAVTPDLVSKGFHAGNIVKKVAALVGGSGGGRPDLAQAGGKDASKLDEAMKAVAGLV